MPFGLVVAATLGARDDAASQTTISTPFDAKVIVHTEALPAQVWSSAAPRLLVEDSAACHGERSCISGPAEIT